jgi:hypothetical protein
MCVVIFLVTRALAGIHRHRSRIGARNPGREGMARRSSKPVKGAACARRSLRGGRWIAAFRRITSSRSGEWARPGTTEADSRQGNDDHMRGMTIADGAVLVTAGNRGIGQELVREALRRGAKCMSLDLNWKVDISQ